MLLHRTRNVFSEKKEQPHQIMKMIYKDWSLSQFNLVKQLWIRMKPWSSILGSLFERRNSRTFSNRLKEEVSVLLSFIFCFVPLENYFMPFCRP